MQYISWLLVSSCSLISRDNYDIFVNCARIMSYVMDISILFILIFWIYKIVKRNAPILKKINSFILIFFLLDVLFVAPSIVSSNFGNNPISEFLFIAFSPLLAACIISFFFSRSQKINELWGNSSFINKILYLFPFLALTALLAIPIFFVLFIISMIFGGPPGV